MNDPNTGLPRITVSSQQNERVDDNFVARVTGKRELFEWVEIASRIVGHSIELHLRDGQYELVCGDMRRLPLDTIDEPGT